LETADSALSTSNDSVNGLVGLARTGNPIEQGQALRQIDSITGSHLATDKLVQLADNGSWWDNMPGAHDACMRGYQPSALAGMELDMPKIKLNFDGECPFRVTLRRSLRGQWKVFNFQSHAG
jgi:hypothetical protein